MTKVSLCSPHVAILLFGSKRIQTRPSSFLETPLHRDQPHVTLSSSVITHSLPIKRGSWKLEASCSPYTTSLCLDLYSQRTVSGSIHLSTMTR